MLLALEQVRDARMQPHSIVLDLQICPWHTSCATCTAALTSGNRGHMISRRRHTSLRTRSRTRGSTTLPAVRCQPQSPPSCHLMPISQMQTSCEWLRDVHGPATTSARGRMRGNSYSHAACATMCICAWPRLQSQGVVVIIASSGRVRFAISW